MTNIMLTRENQRVGKQLLACWANELSFDILNGNLKLKRNQNQRLLVGKYMYMLTPLVEVHVLTFPKRIKKDLFLSLKFLFGYEILYH